MSSRRQGRPHRHRRDVKDRLIQTRVPEHLESALKEEAQKRRLTVSHLIRNMLEDTFELVDGVVAGAGDLAKDSVVLAEQVAHDAGKIAAQVRGAAQDASRIAAQVHDALRPRTAGRGGDVAPPSAAESAQDLESEEDDVAPPSDDPAWRVGGLPAASSAPSRHARKKSPGAHPLSGLDHVLAWNQVVANQAVECAACGKELPRGSVAHLGMSQDPKAPPTWLCPSCLERL